MMKAVLIVVIATLLSVAVCQDFPATGMTADMYQEAFANWQEAYGVSFDSTAEQAARLQQFSQNLDNIAQNNDLLDVYNVDEVEYASNEYSALSEEEFFSSLTGGVSSTGFEEVPVVDEDAAPVEEVEPTPTSEFGAGATAGVVVGGAAAVGGVAAGVVVAKKKGLFNKKKEEVSSAPTTPVAKPRGAGANVFDFDPNNHTSITGRSGATKE
jgi:hypothetical protein